MVAKAAEDFALFECTGTLARDVNVGGGGRKMATAFFTIVTEHEVEGRDDPILRYHEFQAFGDDVVDHVSAFNKGQRLTAMGEPKYQVVDALKDDQFPPHTIKFVPRGPDDIFIPEGAEVVKKAAANGRGRGDDHDDGGKDNGRGRGGRGGNSGNRDRASGSSSNGSRAASGGGRSSNRR